MIFDNSYFENEVREGFFIPGMVKRSWAVQMQILDRVDLICKKAGIKWYAYCGTLLGAVRHHGFIPWDDDLDICMLREDYSRFLELAKKELSSEYKILTLDTEPEYEQFLARITYGDSINTNNDFLMSNCGFPFVAGIDVFPLDYLYEDADKEADRMQRAKALWKEAERNTRNKPQILRQLETVFKEACSEGAKHLALMPYYVQDKGHIYDRAWFDTCLNMEFEKGTINVPRAYYDVLKVDYGRWEVATRSGGVHDYPFYSEQEITLWDTEGVALYRYNPANAVKHNKNSNNERSDKNEIANLLVELKKYYDSCIDYLGRSDSAAIGQILVQCQEYAVGIGTNIEALFVRELQTVKLLEQYCEQVYNQYDLVDRGKLEGIEALFSESSNLLSNVIEKYDEECEIKQIVVCVTKYNQWKFARNIYEELSTADNTDVYIVVLPYANRVDDGSIGEFRVEADSFENFGAQIDFDEFYNSSVVFDELYYQNPFDQYASATTVHPSFYIDELARHTKQMNYIHSLDVFNLSDGKSISNAKHYVITPGVLQADKVYVPSDEIKDTYIKVLEENNIDKNWNEIIIVKDVDNLVKTTREDEKKTLLFYIGQYEFINRSDVLLEWLSDVCKTFNASARLQVIWAFDEELTQLDSELFDCVERKISETNIEKINSKVVINMLDDIDAYYGSPGYLMNQCVLRKMPVMQMKYL